MKNNRSLALTNSIQEFKMRNILGMLENEFPLEIIKEKEIEIEKNKETQSRNRVFTTNTTLLTMVLTAVQEDKSLQNSVDLFYLVHQKQKKQIKSNLEEEADKQKKQILQLSKKPGRPKKYTVKLPKSMTSEISMNTAAYSKARGRIPMELVETLFENSHIKDAVNSYSHWHGYRVLLGDGTYIQMQDTPDIRKNYEIKHEGIGSGGYPQGLLEVIIERGTGQIFSYKLGNRHVSELTLFYEMIDQLPNNSLLLLDDLYNCFEIISKCKRKGIELLMPQKRVRNYELVERIEDGDEIIRIKTPKNRSKWLDENEGANNFLLRKISCKSPDGTEYELVTTILDKNIKKDEIQQLYLTRWDIEISIRETKTIMDINVLRSKTPEMALKELAVSLATYNLVRKLIYTSIKDLPFFPEEDFIFKYYTCNKNILVDKKGRVYSKWSPGRGGAKENNN